MTPLGCLGGRGAPKPLVRDLEVVSNLSAEAKRELYGVLGPALSEIVPPNLDADVDAFAKAFGVDANALARGLRAARFLLTSAAARGLAADPFRADLTALDPGGALAEALMPSYPEAIDLIQKELARAALLAHGKLVERIDWRVDKVSESNKADALRLTVGVLTIGYREGDRRDRITLQLTRESLKELRAMCDRLLRA